MVLGPQVPCQVRICYVTKICSREFQGLVCRLGSTLTRKRKDKTRRKLTRKCMYTLSLAVALKSDPGCVLHRFQVEAENKGWESIVYFDGEDGERYLMGLCESECKVKIFLCSERKICLSE